MKKVKHVTGWTDYPFVELGDVPGQPAPIRHINVVSYDGNKYATVSFERCGDFLPVKVGYLYSQPGRYGQVKQINIRKIERMGDGKQARKSDQYRKAWNKREAQALEMDLQALRLVVKQRICWDDAWKAVEERMARGKVRK